VATRFPSQKPAKKLVTFEAGRVELIGHRGRCAVKLLLRDKNGMETERIISYQIDTTPQGVIGRQGLGP
jgi:hypothetical protein